MFKALFYPREVKFYMDNARVSVTNCMSGQNGQTLRLFCGISEGLADGSQCGLNS